MVRPIALAALSTSDGYRLRYTVSVRGARIAGARGERWRGTFRAKVLVTRNGRYVDTCRSGRLRFTLRPA